MYKKDKTKKSKQDEDKRSKKETMEVLLTLHKTKGQRNLFYMREKSGGLRLPCWAFHPKISGGIDIVFSRGQCKWLLLSLQREFGRQSVGVRSKTRASNSKRTLSTKRKDIKSRRKLVSRKNKRI